MKPIFKFSILFLTTLAIISCYDIVSVSQLTIVPANERFNAEIKIHIKCIENLKDSHFVFAFLIPKELENGLQATVKYNCSLGSGTMQVLKNDSNFNNNSNISWASYLSKYYENGNNTFNDMTWIVFRTKECYSVRKNQEDILGTIFLSYNVGKKNIIFKPSYFIANTTDGFGLNNTIYHGNSVEINHGIGEVSNYSKERLFNVTSSGSPSQENLTIVLNANASPNILQLSPIIYVNATLFTKSNKIVTLNKLSVENRMVPKGSNKWRFNLKLSDYLNLRKEKVKQIVFSFVDGDKRKLYEDNFGKPFIYNF